MGWFDARTVDPSQGLPQWPLGKHRVIAVKSEQTDVKDDPGSKMLVFTLRIIDSVNNGFEGAYRLNLWHKNPQAAEIAGRQLSAICWVVNTHDLNEGPPPNGRGIASELFQKPFWVMVQPQKDERYTQIVAVYDDAGNPPKSGQAQAAAPQQPQFTPAQPQGMPPGPNPPQQPINYGALPAGQPAQQYQAQPNPGFQPGPLAGQQPMQPQQGYNPPAMPQQFQPQAQPGVGGMPQGAQQYQPPPGAVQGGQPSWQQQPAAGAQPNWNK